MLPEQPISFPEFVADQLLTADNLNSLFHYLDVQERGTRTNLIGIGIVCGLEVTVNTAGTEVTISKGCGITTKGYLVRWDETKFENYKKYDAAKELVYSPFYGGGKQKFDIDELKSNASEEGITKITKTYLDDKVALLYVELLEIDAKNCDPESCDDKGKSITLTIRPLLVKKADAVALTGGMAGSNSFNQTWVNLPELKMTRHHVPAADIFDSADVFEGFQKVLSASFMNNLETGLSQTYTQLAPLVKDIYPSNPFTGMSASFAFVHNGSMTAQQLLYMQYYYDLFSDVIYAYEELRKVGMRLLSLCCSDEGLFPQHLLLGLLGTASGMKQDFRHYFIPSPAVCCHGELVGELRILLKRIVLLVQKFSVLPASKVTAFSNEFNAVNRVNNTGTPIRITPSKHGNIPLSEKAIPFYYNVAAGTDKLFQHWNFARLRNGSADHNLSYNAADYNSSNDDVLRPLHYDLEPYNFLRIEGHVGHRYTDALAAINQIRDTNRLPFDVIALSADIRTLREQLASIANSTSNAGLRNGLQGDVSMQCHFQDLEALYDTMAQGLICNLCKEMKYYYAFPYSFRDQTSTTKVPQVPLLKKCDPAFRYTSNTIGDAFEDFYKKLPSGQYIERDQFLAATAFGNFSTINNTTGAQNNNAGVVLGLALLYYIEKLSEIIPTTLIGFNITSFLHRYNDLMIVAQQVKQFHQALSVASASEDNELNLAVSEDVIDHLDSLLQSCRDAQFLALYNDYKVRWVYLAMLQKLGYYVKMHPGIQHKAGVTMGGTFILVYHEQSRVRQANPNIFTTNKAVTENVVRNTDQTVFRNTTAEDIAQAIPKAETGSKAKTDDTAENEAKAFRAAKMEEAPAAAVEASGDIAKETLSNRITASLHQLETTKLKAQLTQKQFAIIDRLFFKDVITRHTLDELTAQLPDKIVIADFYLPYMCCSDCPPVYFIVNETAEAPDAPTISIKDTQYCNADKATYPITVMPAGGSFGNSEGVSDANGVATFNPSLVSIQGDGLLNKVVQITYTKDDQSASTSVTVFAKPKADFEILPGTVFTLIVFNNKSEKAASITWDFGDGFTGTGDHPSHNYAQEGTYTVTLKAINGACSDTITKTVTITKALINIDGNEFCSADKNAHLINVSPEGGEVTGEGTSKNANGVATFRPGSVAFTNNQASKDITLSYAVAGQSVQTTVKVFRTPTAAFTIQVSAAAANIKSFTSGNTFSAQHSWNFGDGGSSVEVNPAHQFTKPGSFVIKHTVTNGACQDESSQTVQIVQEKVTVSINPTQFCSADTQNYQITGSPAGGTASGETVLNTGSTFVFRPNAVAFAQGEGKKDITIQYNAAGQTAQTQVTVFKTPNALFTVSGATAPNIRLFTSNVGFPADILWDFGDGETSTQPSPTHQFKQGTFKVTLTVTNGTCKGFTTQNVVISNDNQPIQKSCGPLDDVIGLFKGLRKINATQFKNFTAIYEAYPEIEDYFGRLSGITGAASEEQIKFFTETEVAALLDKWFTTLNPLVVESDVRQMAIAMWRVLTDLATYVMCIQNGDFKENAINFSALFNKLEGFIKSWSAPSKNFTAADKAQLQLLLDDMTAEGERVKKNGEDATKKTYMTKLNSIITMLTNYLK